MTKFPDITRRPASLSIEVHSLRGSAKGSPLGDDARSMRSSVTALSRGQVTFRAAQYGRVCCNTCGTFVAERFSQVMARESRYSRVRNDMGTVRYWYAHCIL